MTLDVIAVSKPYEFVDENTRNYEEVLSVDFLFPNGTTIEEATSQIDMLVSLADDNDDIKFFEHKPTIYAKSPFVEPDEDLYT